MQNDYTKTELQEYLIHHKLYDAIRGIVIDKDNFAEHEHRIFHDEDENEWYIVIGEQQTNKHAKRNLIKIKSIWFNDVNGRTIFEGDIMSCKDGNIYTVVYCLELNEYCLRQFGENRTILNTVLFSEEVIKEKEFKRIGTIYTTDE